MRAEARLRTRPPCTVCQSRALTEAARTRTRTRPSDTTGRAISRRLKASAEPDPSWTIARIVFLPCATSAPTIFSVLLPRHAADRIVARGCGGNVNELGAPDGRATRNGVR